LPSDFLLPLFVLTLLANAILVAFAIRGMRRGQWDDDRPIGAAPRPPAGGRAVSSPTQGGPTGTDAEPTNRDEVAQGELARAVAMRRSTEDVGTGSARSADTGPTAEAEPPSSGPAGRPEGSTAGPADRVPEAGRKIAPAPKARRTSKPAAAADASATRSAPAEPRRGRRRFSLPPLDDDHEKVNRSIKSFLGGIEGSASAIGAPDPPATEISPTGATTSGPTTVALIAVDGLPNEAARAAVSPREAARPDSATTDTGMPEAGMPDTKTPDAGTPPDREAGQPDAVAEALAMVERTLRAAARGSDIVTIGDRGRFRIVLPATGELAARAYLRRIRATIEPRLESAGRPLRLAVATATVLDESLDHAVERAEHRLAVALASDGSPDGATGPHRSSGRLDDPGHQPVTPRAAAD
jgi:hypothetical protein